MELTLFVDHQCNLRCTYCYNGDKFPRRMSSETMRRALDFVLDPQPPFLDVSFFGGEPLMCVDLVGEAVAYAEERVAAQKGRRTGLRFLMNTNATLIDPEVVALFSRPRRSAFFVSVDGDRETHDRFRIYGSGKGSFDQVCAGLGLLRDAEIPYHMLAVINLATVRSLGSTVCTLLGMGAGRLNLSPNFRDDWTDESMSELRQGLAGAGDAWMEAFRRGEQIALEPFHGKILTHLKGGIPCPSRCQLGGSELTVAPSGRYYPCAQMVGEDRGDGYVMGHVDSGIDHNALAAMQVAKDRIEQICAPCALKDRCQSHCGCRHVALTGKLGEITAALCEIEAAFIDQADRVAETLFAENDPAFIDYYYKRSWAPAHGGLLTALRRAKDA